MIFEIRGHHIDAIAELYFDKKEEGMFNFPTRFYGKEFSFGIRLTLEHFLANSEVQLKIVKGLDYFCQNDCPRLQEECYPQEGVRTMDDYALEQYGLTIGQVLTVEDFLNIIVDYKEKTECNSARMHLAKSLRAHLNNDV